MISDENLQDALSTSAALRRVEQERDAAIRGGYEADKQRNKYHSAFKLAEELRLKAIAELASARTELASFREVIKRRAEDLAARADQETIEPSACSQVFLKDVDTATVEDLRTEVRRLDLRLRWMHTHYDDEATTFLLTAYELGRQRDEALRRAGELPPPDEDDDV